MSPIQITAQISEASRREIEHRLAAVPKGFERAAVPALNRTAGTIRTRGAREISTRLHVRVKDARSRLSMVRAQTGRLVAGVRIKNTRFSWYQMGAREQKGRGVTLPGISGGPAVQMPHWFENPAGGHFAGSRQIMTRARDEESGEMVPRYPIHIKWGPRIVDMMENVGGLIEEIQHDAGEVLEKNMLSQISRLLHSE